LGPLQFPKYETEGGNTVYEDYVKNVFIWIKWWKMHLLPCNL